jgi:hypothetical protein
MKWRFRLATYIYYAVYEVVTKFGIVNAIVKKAVS